MKMCSAWPAVLMVALLPAAAFAQSRPWIADRAIGEGPGIRAGDLELHPGVAGELGYDSNYFQRSGDNVDASGRSYPNDHPIDAAYRLRSTPSLTLSTISAQRRVGDTQSAVPPQLTFRSSLFASYNELFGAGSDYDFSKQRHVDGGADLQFQVLPQRTFSFDGNGKYTRSVAPSNDPAIVNSWNRDMLGAGAGLTWRPGGGTFDWRLGYDFGYTYFEAQNYRTLDNVNHTFDTRGRYRFFPRTALIYDGSVNGDIVQARIGLNGLITNSFSLLAEAGWASSFFVPTTTPVLSNYDSVVGQVELDWFVLPQPKLQPGDATVGLSKIGVGYVRDISISYLADYYRRDRGYAKVSYFVGGRFLIDLQGGYSLITHPPFQTRQGGGLPNGATENRVDVQLFTEYRTSDSLGLNMTLRYDASLKDVPLLIPTTTGGPYYDNLAFRRFQAWLGVRWFM
jgi:hypothetical protein